MLRLIPTIFAALVLSAGAAHAELKKEWLEYRHGDTQLKGYFVYDDGVAG